MALEDIDWEQIREHYDTRRRVHLKLLELHDDGEITEFTQMALGISDGNGNYSASEHGLGARILASNPGRDVGMEIFKVAEHFINLETGHDVPRLVRETNLAYFKIGVASEMSCMVNPKNCWVTNVRTIWTHLVIEDDNDDFRRADESLILYREHMSGEDSLMAFKIWETLHGELANTMSKLAEQGSDIAKQHGVKPGRLKFLWADAIADELYAERHGQTLGRRR